MQTRNLVEVLQRINICGCGNPNLPLEAVCEMLEHMPLYEHTDFVNDDKWKTLILHVMTGWKLIEHGGSVEGSWITADGSLLLEFLHLIHCQERYWACLSTAALNETIPDELTVPWLVEQNGKYFVLDEDDEEALAWSTQ